MEPPVWLLDVDGVLNANKPGWGQAPRKRIISGFVVRWAPKLIVRMHRLQTA